MLLTVKELSARLNIKPSTLYLWAGKGKIPCLKIHGLVRFQENEIEPWLKRFRKQPKTEVSRRVHPRTFDIDRVIARVKKGAYNPRHGETRQRSSPIGEEAADGAV
jgi:excisionase family DNA binding protein